jgi:hypothetical protein
MNIVRNIWPQTEPRLGDPDSLECGYGLHPAIVKLSLLHGGTIVGPDPRSRIDLKIGWRRLKEALVFR